MARVSEDAAAAPASPATASAIPTTASRCMVISSLEDVEAREDARARTEPRRHDGEIHRNAQRAELERLSEAERERDTGRRHVRADTQFELAGGPDADEPGQARNGGALIESADHQDEFVQRDRPVFDARELPFELPAELRD